MPYAFLIIKVPETIARVSACIAVRYLQMYVQHRGTDSRGGQIAHDNMKPMTGKYTPFFLTYYMQQWQKIQHNLSRNKGILLLLSKVITCSFKRFSLLIITWCTIWQILNIVSVLEKLHGKRITSIHAVERHQHYRETGVLVYSEKNQLCMPTMNPQPAQDFNTDGKRGIKSQFVH